MDVFSESLIALFFIFSVSTRVIKMSVISNRGLVSLPYWTMKENGVVIGSFGWFLHNYFSFSNM